MLVALIALVGVLPYIALQLKAVSVSFAVLAAPAAHGALPDTALLMALMLALFAILFGTRQVGEQREPPRHGAGHRLRVPGQAVAFVAVGLYVTFGLSEGFGPAYRQALACPGQRGAERRRWQLAS